MLDVQAKETLKADTAAETEFYGFLPVSQCIQKSKKLFCLGWGPSMSGASLCGLPSRCCKLAALALASAGQHLDLQRVLSKPRRGPIGALLYARDTCHARANRRQHPCGNRGQCAGARRPKLSRPSVLLSLPLPAQCKFAVLQGSLQHRVAHLPVARWSVVEGAMSAAADAIADTALQIGNCQVSPGSEDDMYARAQLQLPMRHGGMGLHRLSPVSYTHLTLPTILRV